MHCFWRTTYNGWQLVCQTIPTVFSNGINATSSYFLLGPVCSAIKWPRCWCFCTWIRVPIAEWTQWHTLIAQSLWPITWCKYYLLFTLEKSLLGWMQQCESLTQMLIVWQWWLLKPESCAVLSLLMNLFKNGFSWAWQFGLFLLWQSQPTAMDKCATTAESVTQQHASIASTVLMIKSPSLQIYLYKFTCGEIAHFGC